MDIDPAYSYLRFSSPEQAKGDSQRRQNALRDAWLARRPEVRLDTSITLEDKGISGFTGDHRSNPDRHALAAFLYAVERKRVPRGAYLIVESLDRLSREDILPALTLVLNLIGAGIRIVQLLPVEMVYDERANPMHLMMMIMELSRGHSESAMKSERVGGAWKEKKRLAAADRVPLTKRVPAWLRLVDGGWEIVAEAADAVRRIYRWAIEGYGLGAITKKLNAARVPPIGTAEYWARSYVAKILSNPAVIGQYQPHRGRGKKRQPDGDPVPRYYPAVVSEKEWYAARAAVASRRGRAGRPMKDRVNVFAGLLFDARGGGAMQQANKGKKGGGRVLVSYRAVQGVAGSRYTSFPFDAFERAVLSCLREVDPGEILDSAQGSHAARSLALAGRLAQVEGEAEKVKARLRAKFSDAVADVLEQHEEERRSLIEQLADAQREASAPLSEAWGEARTLLDALDGAPDLEDARVRLRSVLRRIVERVWCLFVPKGRDRLAAVQVVFRDSDRRRSYLIRCRPGAGGSVPAREASWRVWSLADAVALGPLDLTRPAHAEALAAELLEAKLP